ncbi:Calx-beta domain-containing protein [Bermanella sp. R86510]|uniref:Calx-beta domain-containing protein n=1 Tax=unclassified Bermanella TaxID=2627862 RepID=UPI0037C77114
MGFQYIVKWIFTLFIISAVAACSSDSGDDGSTSRDIEQPPSIQEGHSDTQTLTLTLVSPVSGALSYETFNITAAEKSDYVAIQGNITVEEGAEYDFDVTVYGDTQIEADEMFGLRFTDASGAEVSTLMGTITNDDFPNVSVSSPEVTELDVGTSRLRFEFILTDYVVDDYTLNVSSLTDEQLARIDREQYPYVATPDVDFEAVNQEIVFKAGELTKTLEVIVSSDDIIEGDEIVFLNVTSDDIDVLSEPYAKGVIRTDETPKVNGNGFDFTYADDSPKLSLMTEGTTDDDSQRNWKAINIAFDIKQPENIKQAQMVALSILPEEEYLELIPENDVSYVTTKGKDADICLNLETDLSLEDTPCETEQAVMVEPGQERVEFTVFVQQDARRESNDTFMLTLANDQNVRFLDVPGIAGEIINDDSEELFVESEGLLDIVSLNDFTKDGGELSILEPEESGSENSLTYNVTLSLKTQIDDVFPVKYDIVPYFAKKGASLSEFTSVSGEVIEFDAETSSHDIPITVNGDGNYDGDKYIQVRFENDSIQPLVIRIVDSNPPKINIEPKGDPLAEEEGDGAINGPVYPLFEQANDSYDDSNSGTRDYAFNLKLDQARVAITDLKYELVLQPYNKGFSAQTLETCQDLSTPSGERHSTATTNPEAQDQDLDVTLHVEGSESYYNHGDTVTIKRGSTQVGWTLKVNNDSLIECAEYFKVGFIPEGGTDIDGSADQNGTSAIFRIDNKDGVKVSLDGFDVVEGVDGVATLEVNKPITASLALAVKDGTHNCSTDDIGDFVSAVGITTSQLSNITTSIPTQNNNLVEPTEDCQLTVSAENDTHAAFPVQYEYNQTYCQETQGCDYAVGRIQDNDKLTIEASVASSEEPTDLDADKGVNFIAVTWDRPIAPNASITLHAALADSCETENQSCASDADFFVKDSDGNELPFPATLTIGSSNNSDLTARFQMDIKDDDIVEGDESATFTFSVYSGDQFVETLPEDTPLNVVDGDKVIISITDITSDSDCQANTIKEADECEIDYEISRDKDFSENVNISLRINEGVNNTVRVNESEYSDVNIEFGSADISKEEDSGSNRFYSIISIVEAGELTNNELSITVHSDDIVEVDETLHLTFEAEEGEGYFILNASNIEKSIPNDDKVTIKFFQQSGEEKNPLDSPLFVPFHYKWDKVISPEVPAIQFAINLDCSESGSVSGSDPVYCAGDDDISITTDLIELNPSSNQNLGYISPPTTNQSLGVTYSLDTLVEQDEKLRFKVSKTGVGLNLTNEAGREYIDAFDVNNGTQHVDDVHIESIIENDDFLTLTIEDVTVTDGDCNGISEEAGCEVFELSWGNGVANNVGLIGLNVVLPSQDDGVRYENQGNVTDPKDYSVFFNGSEINYNTKLIDLSTDVNGGSTSSIKVKIIDDEFVEPEETIEIYLTRASDFISSSIDDNGTGLANNSQPYARTIANNDFLEVSIGGNGNSGAGFEPRYDNAGIKVSGIERPFIYTTQKPVAPNTENIILSVTHENNCGQNNVCAEDGNGKDFTFERDVEIHDQNSYTPIRDSGEDLEVVVSDDTIVEADEVIRLTLEESSEYVSELNGSDSGSATINYTIENNDITTLSFVEKDRDRDDEGGVDGSDVRESYDISYQVKSSNEISEDVREISVGTRLDNTITAPASASGTNPDVTLPGTLVIKAANQSLGAGAEKELVIQVLGDKIVEQDEDVIPEITIDNSFADIAKVDSANNKGEKFTISNDDSIHLEVVGGECNLLGSDLRCNEGEVDSIFSIKPTQVYETQGIASPNITLELDVDNPDLSADSGTDFTFVETVGLETAVTDINAAVAMKDFMTIKGDTNIERDEKIILTATFPSYIELTFPDSFTIKNDDYLNVTSRRVFNDESDYEFEVCNPSNNAIAIEGGNIAITAHLDNAKDETNMSNDAEDTNNIERGDVVGCSETLSSSPLGCTTNIDLSGLAANACEAVSVFSFSDGNDPLHEPNEWFSLSLELEGDERCENGICMDRKNMVVQNDVILPILDTNAERCVTGKWYEESIPGANNDIWHVSIRLSDQSSRCEVFPYPYSGGDPKYRPFQDVDVTRYGNLNYSLIQSVQDENGDEEYIPVIQDLENGSDTCVQDNNSGYIWQKGSTSQGFADIETKLTTLNSKPNPECGLEVIDGKQWYIPTVQQLYGLINIDGLNKEELFDLPRSGDDITTWASKFWTKDSCDDDSYWVVDFVNAEMSCVHKDESGINFRAVYYDGAL